MRHRSTTYRFLYLFGSGLTGLCSFFVFFVLLCPTIIASRADSHTIIRAHCPITIDFFSARFSALYLAPCFSRRVCHPRYSSLARFSALLTPGFSLRFHPSSSVFIRGSRVFSRFCLWLRLSCPRSIGVYPWFRASGLKDRGRPSQKAKSVACDEVFWYL